MKKSFTKKLETIKKFNLNTEDLTFELELKAPKAKDIKAIETLDGKRLLELLKIKAKDNKEHFGESGWDIWTSGSVGDVMYDLLGFNLEDLITAFIAEKSGSNVKYKSGGAMFTKKDGYFPTFYDEYTGEIIIVENGDDKSYINKYSEHNGYLSLGCL